MAAATAGLPRRWLGAAAILLAVAILVAVLAHRQVSPPSGPVRFGYGPKDYATALTLANDYVALGTERVARSPGDWAWQESYARALLGRARLTGSFDDLLAASQALSRAMNDAVYPSGPVLTDAVGNLTIHRLAPVPADLNRLAAWAIPAEPGDHSEAVAIGGDVAFYSGRYADAFRAYTQADRIDHGAGNAVRLANWYKKMGRFEEAIGQFDAAIAETPRPTRQFYANMLLQKGVVELARGDWDAAKALFARADATFPGYWLTEAHVAQMVAASGDLKGAERRYLAIVGRAGPGLVPDVMDALAALYRAKGDAANSRLWASRAGAIWARRLAQLAEAAYGHALEHELVLGDPARALDLARRNYAARPYGDSATMLGWALLANGRPRDAAAVISALEPTGWRTAQQYVVLSEAEALLGHSDASEAARRQALSINPRAFDPAASLIWFGNH